MPTSETFWYCNTCGMKHKSEDEAIKCETNHYTVVSIDFPIYEKGRKCPQAIQVSVDIGGDIKQVTYLAAQEGWGGK